MQTLRVTLGKDFLSHKTKVKFNDVFTKTKVIGLYFSALWCPPCSVFLPELIKLYEKANEKEKQFEIIYVSSDNDEEEFNECYNKMPWLAIPYESDAIELAQEEFKVSGVPVLIVLNGKTGQIIDNKGRKTFTDKGSSTFDHWASLCL